MARRGYRHTCASDLFWPFLSFSPVRLLRQTSDSQLNPALSTLDLNSHCHWMVGIWYFVGDGGAGQRMLWLRALDTTEPRVLPGTEDARYPILVARQQVRRIFHEDEAEEDCH